MIRVITCINDLLPEKQHKVLWSMIVFISFFAIFIPDFNDSDLYYMIPTGRYLLKDGMFGVLNNIHTTNPFITTDGLNIVMQNWLYCIILASLYDMFGGFGLIVFQMLQIALMAALTYGFIGRHEYSTDKLGDYNILRRIIVYSVFIVFSYVNLRPEIFTYCILLAEIILLEAYTEKRFAYGFDFWFIEIISIVVIFVLSVNVHASYICLNFVVALPYFIKAVKEDILVEPHDRIRNILSDICLTVLATASCLVNPYGFEMMTYTFKSLTANTFDYFAITELQPLSFTDGATWFIIGFTALFVWAVVKKKLNATGIYMYIIFLVPVLLVRKWLSAYSVGLIYMLASLYERGAKNKTPIKININRSTYTLVGILLMTVAMYRFVATFYGVTPQEFFSNKFLDSPNTIAQYKLFEPMADYLDKNDPDATVFSESFEGSNYFEYRGYKVYYDARPEIYVEEIAGTDEVVRNTVIATSYLDKVKGLEESPEDMCITSKEFKEAVQDIGTDYYVAQAGTTLDFYLSEHTELYSPVVNQTAYTLYKRIK